MRNAATARSLLASLLLVLLSSVARAASDEVVFRGASSPPTPFAQRPAQLNGAVAGAKPGIELHGTLFHPDGDGPFPALVMLHGCGGASAAFGRITAERYVSWGYAALWFDSFGPRGIRERCSATAPAADRIADAL